MNTSNGRQRRSTRGREASTSSIDDTNKRPRLSTATRRSRRLLSSINYCYDLCYLDAIKYCSGCSVWMEAPRRTTREESTRKQFACLQIWKTKSSDIPPRYANHYSCAKEAIEREQQVSIEALQEEEEEETTLESPQGSFATRQVSPDQSTPPSNKQPRQLNFHSQQIRSQNQQIEVGLPTSHTVIHKTELAKLRAIEKKYKALKSQVERVKVDPSRIAKAVYSTAAATTPALALSSMEHIIPLICYAALVDTGLLENIDIDKFCRSFPKYTFMRDTALYDRAAELLLQLSSTLKNKRVYLSCDKGNKKGVGHFVKVLS